MDLIMVLWAATAIRNWEKDGTLTDHRVVGPYRRFRWEDVEALRRGRKPA